MRSLLFFGFLYFVLSCEQNPLAGIPSEILSGARSTGEHHLPYFQNSLYEKLVKVEILNHPDPMMIFREGKTHSYDIQVRLLHNLGSKYTVELDSEKSLILDGLMVGNLNFEGKNKAILDLKWTPIKTFTRAQNYKKFSLPLFLHFKNRQTGKKSFTVKKTMDIMVYRVLDRPEIYKIKTAFDEYEKLDDGYFYAKYGAKKLNFKYYDQIFAGRNKKKNISSHLKFYSEIIHRKFNAKVISNRSLHYKYTSYTPSNWKTKGDFDDFKIYDQYQNPVSDDLLDFIKQPVYRIAQDASYKCDKSMTVFVGKNDKRCLIQLDVQKPVDFYENIYIKHYQIPDKVDPKNLFYKIKSRHLCEVYHYISFAHLIKKEKWQAGDTCYLSAEKYGIRNEVKEKEDIYILKEADKLEFVDKTLWKFSFDKIKKSIQWQMGGYQPIQDNVIKIHLVRSMIKEEFEVDVNDIQIYVKDYNFFIDPPVLTPVQRGPGDLLYWFKDLSAGTHWKLGKIIRIKRGEWQLNYKIKVNDLKDGSKRNPGFRLFDVELFPASLDNHMVTQGKEVHFRTIVLPFIKVKYFENFDQKKNVQFSMNVKHEKGLKKWLSSTFSLSGAITTQYLFPARFLNHIQELTSFDKIPFFNFKSDRKILNYLNFFGPQPQSSEHYCSDQKTETRQIAVFALKENYCDCSGWMEHKKQVEDENQEKTYIENVCSYKMELQLDSENLRDSSGKMISSYLQYDFFLTDTALSLNNRFYEDSTLRDIPFSIRTEPLASRYPPPTKISDIRSRFHIFSNLRPKLKCISEAGLSDKKCKIIYPFNIDFYNDQLVTGKNLFPEDEELWAQLLCLDESHAQGGNSPSGDCSCDKKPVFSNKGMEFQCVFKNDQRGFLSVQLKTESPYIYFLNTDATHNEEPQSYKRTPAVVLRIP